MDRKITPKLLITIYSLLISKNCVLLSNKTRMKIAIINRSDLNGGAAVFTYRLMNAFRKEGVDASMLVTEKLGNDENVISYAHKFADKYHFLAERLQIFLQNSFSRENLFKVDTAQWGRNIASHPEVKNADVIILNWINQGALSLDCVEKLCDTGKPIIWNMHDMWECTGICHHAYDCTRFRKECGMCQYLKSNKISDLSHSTWKRKKSIYSAPNLHFVAVSNWLAQKCKESSLLATKRVTVIPNTTNVEEYSCSRLPNSNYGISADKKVIAIGAARLDDPVKGFPILLSALKWLKAHKPAVASQIHLILFGGLRDISLLQEIDIPYTYLSKINANKVKDVLAHADVIISSSLYESFGGTLVEGMAAGCTPVTFGNGGQTDIVDHLHTGYIAMYKSHEDLAYGIEWAINANLNRQMLHDEMQKRFSPTTVVEKYLSLLEKINR